MVAEVIAVIAGENDNCVVQQLFFTQGIKDLSYLVIDLFDQPCIVGANFLLVRFRKLGIIDAVPRLAVALNIVPT